MSILLFVFPMSFTKSQHLFWSHTVNCSKMYRPTSAWAWAFLGIACFQACFTIIVDSFLLYRFDQRLLSLSFNTDSDAESSRKHALGLTPTYLVILVLGLLYHISLSWDTLRLQNTIQICGVCCFAAAMSTYSMAEVIEVRSAVSDFRIHMPAGGALLTAAESGLLVAIPAVLAITTLGLCFLAWKLSQMFAWTIYKSFSADMNIRKRYTLLEVSGIKAFLAQAGTLTIANAALRYTPEIRLFLLPRLRGSTASSSRWSSGIANWEDRALSYDRRCSSRNSTARTCSMGCEA